MLTNCGGEYLFQSENRCLALKAPCKIVPDDVLFSYVLDKRLDVSSESSLSLEKK